MKVFDEYARYYDLLYRDKDYRQETDFILSLLKSYAPEGNSILELGCGTGIHAQLIAEAGYQVHGIDLSDSMLKIAQARKEGLDLAVRGRLDFLAGDVRDYNTNNKFDIVLSLFHVFSYQVRNEDLRRAFDTAARHLDSGGVFIFDYWYGPAVLAQRPETRIKRCKDSQMDILRIAESRMDEQQNIVDVTYETHVKSEGKENIIHELHRMRYLFLQEIDLLAGLHGFSTVCHRQWLGEKEPSVDSWSAFSVLKKI